MKMEGVGGTGRVRGGNGERELDDAVCGESEDAAAGEQIGRTLRTAHDLQQDRHCRGGEGSAVDEEVRAILESAVSSAPYDKGDKPETHETEIEVEGVVNTADHSSTGRSDVSERHEARLLQQVGAAGIGCVRLDGVRAVVAQDSRVDATRDGDGTDVRNGPEPVVTDVLVGIEHERVALPGEDLDGVRSDWVDIHSVGLDDTQAVALNLEGEVRVARQADQTEAVSLALRDGDNSEVSGGGGTGETTKPVDKRGVPTEGETGPEGGSSVRPIRQSDDGGICDALVNKKQQ